MATSPPPDWLDGVDPELAELLTAERERAWAELAGDSLDRADSSDGSAGGPTDADPTQPAAAPGLIEPAEPVAFSPASWPRRAAAASLDTALIVGIGLLALPVAVLAWAIGMPGAGAPVWLLLLGTWVAATGYRAATLPQPTPGQRVMHLSLRPALHSAGRVPPAARAMRWLITASPLLLACLHPVLGLAAAAVLLACPAVSPQRAGLADIVTSTRLHSGGPGEADDSDAWQWRGAA